METPNENLALAVLIIFATLSLPTIFVTWRHGVRGLAILGWGFLFIFCSLKIIGSAMQLSDPKSSGANIVNNIGLSPLLLAVAGVLHESRYYHASPTKRRQEQSMEIASAVAYHMFIMLGLALVAAGTAKLMAGGEAAERGWNVARVGAVFLFVGWLALVGLTVQTTFASREVANASSRRRDATRLRLAVIAALPFLGVRVIATLAYMMSKDQSLSAAGGTMGIRIGLYVIHEIIVALILLGAGLLAINLPRQPDDKAVMDTGSGYRMMQPVRPGEAGAEY